MPRQPAPTAKRMLADLRTFALGYPQVAEEFPWGDRVIKVRGKIFVFLNEVDDALTLSVKLPFTGEGALRLPFTRPTPYGLGKSGWVSATVKPRDLAIDEIKNWIDESYRAVAPKKLAALAPPPAPAGAKAKR